MNRLGAHPILDIPQVKKIPFTFNGKPVEALEGEVISSALQAQGITVFGHHHKDGAPLGLFCSNGQCSQCLVIADGVPVKGCMTLVNPGMEVLSCEGKPVLPEFFDNLDMHPIKTIGTECLVIGGGPAGLAAAAQLGKAGVNTLVVDDKHRLGGKLTLQTHVFFGSREACYAGTRGIDIANMLKNEVEQYESVETWVDSPAIGVFQDGRVGILKQGEYVLVKPETVLVAAGAREKTLPIPGCDLPGVFGAGAFQTLVNRDLVKPAEKIFICGGGNVGLITAYHAIQADIEVAGIVEAQKVCGGYKVHLDKLLRLGVPVYTSHTVLRTGGGEHVESVTIGSLGEDVKAVPGTEKTFEADALLIAVGLSPVNELYLSCKEYGFQVYAAGDAEEISEASAAMFSGRLKGRAIVEYLKGTMPGTDDAELLEILKSKPGAVKPVRVKELPGNVYPVLRCAQEIPCNPCVDVCKKGSITIQNDTLTGIPEFTGEECSGCGQCVLICPGLAIVLVDERYDPGGKRVLITLPFELDEGMVKKGDTVITTGGEGETIGTGIVHDIATRGKREKRQLLVLDVPFEHRLLAAGFRIHEAESGSRKDVVIDEENTIICRCERITKKEILRLIRWGYRDMNQIKAALRTGMGSCGGKTCEELILGLFRLEGVPLREITGFKKRPPFMEVPLKLFAGIK